MTDHPRQSGRPVAARGNARDRDRAGIAAASARQGHQLRHDRLRQVLDLYRDPLRRQWVVIVGAHQPGTPGQNQEPVPVGDRHDRVDQVDRLGRELFVKQIGQRINQDAAPPALQQRPGQNVVAHPKLAGPSRPRPPGRGQTGVARAGLPTDSRQLGNRTQRLAMGAARTHRRAAGSRVPGDIVPGRRRDACRRHPDTARPRQRCQVGNRAEGAAAREHQPGTAEGSADGAAVNLQYRARSRTDRMATIGMA